MRISDWSSDVCSSDLVALFWVLALHSWVQTPAGATLIDARYQVYDWYAAVFNPSLGWNLGLMALWSALAAAFLILGVTRSEERRVGKECVSTCSPRWQPYH